MDTVIGKKTRRPRRGAQKAAGKPVLLVLTERKTRQEIIRKIANKRPESVVRELNILERKYGSLFPKVFKSITVDNGSEFYDVAGIQKSVLRKDGRTTLYFCHPYSSYERGTNENLNRMVRRKYPKGTDFGTVTKEDIQAVEDWIN